jgi:Rieske 2Fe-2S family protein
MDTATRALPRTLPGAAYVDPATFAAERERIFSHHWLCVGRVEEVPTPGDLTTREVAGESLIVAHGDDGTIRAFANACRHRGTRLVDGDQHVRRVITCPYHAWSYDLRGGRVGTPNVGLREPFDREAWPLVEVRCETWEGFVFVNLDDDADPLLSRLADDPEEPMQFTRFGMGELRIGRPNAYPDVAANWKILIQNYHECLHCPTVHPELVRLIPVYRRGEIVDDPDSWDVPLVEGATSLTATGSSSLPPLPGIGEEDRCAYSGCFVFPNLFLDLTSDTVIYAILWPTAPDRTTITEGYLFRPETIAEPGFDPSEVVDFSTLVMRQDLEVCERAQLGVGSRAFADGGVYPHADRFVAEFDERYLEAMRTG